MTAGSTRRRFIFSAGGISGVACVDTPELPKFPGPSALVTSGLGYVRFQGRNASHWWKWWAKDQAYRYDYNYRRWELMGWVPRLREIERQSQHTFVIFNNHWQGQAVVNAQALQRLLKRSRSTVVVRRKTVAVQLLAGWKKLEESAMARHRLVATGLPTESSSLRPVALWGLPQITGRFVELSGTGATATLTAAFGLVLEAQCRHEPVTWITLPSSTFFPPDAAAGGIDLDSLAIVRARDSYTAARSAMAAHSLGRLRIGGDRSRAEARSGGAYSTKVLMKVEGGRAEYASIPTPLQTRLVGLAQKNDTAVVVLTEKPAQAGSLGSLVSLRAEVRRSSMDYRIELEVLKDKRRGPGQVHQETCRGPAGMC